MDKNILKALDTVSVEAYFLYDMRRKQIVWISEKLRRMTGKFRRPSVTGNENICERCLSQKTQIEVYNILAQISIRMKDESNKPDIYFSFSVELDMPHVGCRFVNIKATPYSIATDASKSILLCSMGLTTGNEIGHFYVGYAGRLDRVLVPLDGKDAQPADLIEMSELEKKVMWQSAKGYTNSQIAGNLFRSEETIKKIKTIVFKKTNTSNITESLVYCMNQNLFWYSSC